MRYGIISATICSIPCTIEYEYGDPLPETWTNPHEPAEINLVRVLDQEGREASWLERKLGSDEWQRIRELIEEKERP